MKNYVVRLRNYEGAIIDGGVYNASNTEDARKMYIARCLMLGIDIATYDYITVEEIAL